ncbi:hypothetical protein MPDQ_006244 [Monascus purpureus]|uniref:Uncharacterized protein n=1 Tax=Monascus purpureus TaxID=5098 RepID=A0A507QUV1_MONPU|nr:hypothetical protein MPDQ_006244 [Monascus purpureus]BDD61813.1 hypothetical protein MAP00_006837 [Monascus purpureus]
MPPPSDQRGVEFQAADQVSTLTMQGFFTGALRFGSAGIIGHMILMLPHPFTFPRTSAPVETGTGKRPSFFSREHLKSTFFYRPLEGFSDWISPTSRVYRTLTPQFKVFIQIAIMTLGGCIWAEKRYNEYIKLIRRMKRIERAQARNWTDSSE